MWTLLDRSPAGRLGAAAAYLAAVALFVVLQELGLYLRREEQRAWWASTGRDFLNAAGVAAIAGALVLFGFPAPAAMLVGGTLTLLLFGMYVFLATRTRSSRPAAWGVAAGLLLAAPVLAWPEGVLRLFGDAAAALFPTGR